MHDSGTQNPNVCNLSRMVQDCGSHAERKLARERRAKQMDKFEEDAKTKVLDALQA